MNIIDEVLLMIKKDVFNTLSKEKKTSVMG
jgi:hypothetical protein